MRVRSRAIYALACLATAGCTLILGYGDPVEEARVTEARDAEQESAPPAVDASDASDAGADVGIDAPFCETLIPKPSFCSSFDGPSFLSGWADIPTSNVRVERNVMSFVSPPASLRVALARQNDAGVNGGVGVDFVAYQNKTFVMKVGFDVRVEAAAPQGALAVIATPLLLASADGVPYILQLACRPLSDGSTVSIAVVEVKPATPPSAEHRSTESLVVGKWSRIDLTIVIASAQTLGNSTKLVVDGRTAFEGPLLLPIGNGIPSASLGIATVDSDTTAWSVAFDNATIDIR